MDGRSHACDTRCAEKRALEELEAAAREGHTLGQRVLAAIMGQAPVPLSSAESSIFKHIEAAQLSIHERRAMTRLLGCLARSPALTHHAGAAPILVGLIGAVRRHDRWVRRPEDWVSRAKSGPQQALELIAHLFAKYPVPSFLDRCWFDGRCDHQEWFVHIGGGQSIRTAPDLPLRVSRRMAHLFGQAPVADADAALRWAQVRALGGDAQVACGVVEAGVPFDPSLEGAIERALRFIVANPGIEPRQYDLVIEYAKAQTAERLRGVPAAAVLLAASQRRLEVEAERWDSETDFAWPESGIPAGVVTLRGLSSARFVELLDTRALRMEGLLLRHCVASYGSDCLENRAAIFSMRRSGRRILTIEVDPTSGLVVQAKGVHNAPPTGINLRLLQSWMSRCGLRLARL